MSACRNPERRALMSGAGAVLLSLLVPVSPAEAQTLRERLRERRQRLRERRQERRDRRDEDWRAVREAVRRGEIEPLRVLMAHFEDVTGHQIIDVRYRRRGRHHLYGFKVVAEAGRLRWYVVNAATREILTVNEARARYGQ